MPKSSAEMVRASMAVRRERSRALGLCYTCCRGKTKSGYTICVACNVANIERQRRKRKRDREVAEMQQIVAAHEAAGDKARAHSLFDVAAQHYREALNVGAITPDDRHRLVHKFGSASFLTSDPAIATTWHGHALDTDLNNAEKAEKFVEILSQITRQMWIDSKSQEALALYEEAVRIAEIHGTDQFRKQTTLSLMTTLVVMGRFDEAARYIDTLGNIENTDNLTMRINYYWKKGFIAAMRGSTAQAYDDLERAVQAAKDDPTKLPMILQDYAIAAIALGDIERARTLCEQALLVVRRNHLGWLIPRTCMFYADILARMGRYISAREYVLEALSSDAQAPILEEHVALVGIPIALHLNDEATLRKCVRPAAIDLAFQTGEPARVGPVAAAFAQLYAKQGQRRKAQTLLHRALEIVTYVDESIDLPLVVAQHGARADIPSARLLLEKRRRFPSADVAQACVLLFDALVAQRMQKREAPRLAAQAVECFNRLHWYAYGNLARSLMPLPLPIPAAHAMHDQPLLGALPALTERERQVVNLALQGHTNRTIAQQLSIREHTVEKHMSSIMTRLGIRSRHQLVDAMTDAS